MVLPSLYNNLRGHIEGKRHETLIAARDEDIERFLFDQLVLIGTKLSAFQLQMCGSKCSPMPLRRRPQVLRNDT